MALAITRALGRICLVPSTPRLLRSTVVSTAAPRPSFSFVQSVGGRPLQRRPPSASSELRPVAAVAFATTTRCSKSAEKRHRQSEKRRAQNKSRKTTVKKRMKKVLKEFDAFRKEPPGAESELDHVKPLMSDAFKAIDKAVQKGTLHRNTGARRKSRLSRARRRLLVQAGLAEPLPKPNPKSLVEEYEAKQRARRAAVKKRIQEQLEAERAEEEREASELA